MDNKTITINDLAVSIGQISTSINELKTDVGELKTNVGVLKTDVGELKTNVGDLATKMDNLETKMDKGFKNADKKSDDILEIVNFIKDNAATQESVDRIDEKFENKIGNLHADMSQNFSSVHSELAEIKNELNDIKQKINQTINTERDDTRVIGGDYLKLLKRVKVMEEKIQQLELARA